MMPSAAVQGRQRACTRPNPLVAHPSTAETNTIHYTNLLHTETENLCPCKYDFMLGGGSNGLSHVGRVGGGRGVRQGRDAAWGGHVDW